MAANKERRGRPEGKGKKEERVILGMTVRRGRLPLERKNTRNWEKQKRGAFRDGKGKGGYLKYSEVGEERYRRERKRDCIELRSIPVFT